MHTEDQMNTEEPSPTGERTHTTDPMQTTYPKQAQISIITEEPFNVNTEEPEKSNFEDIFRKRKLKLPTLIGKKRSKEDTRVSQKTLVPIQFNAESPKKAPIPQLRYKECNSFKSGTWRQHLVKIPSGLWCR